MNDEYSIFSLFIYLLPPRKKYKRDIYFGETKIVYIIHILLLTFDQFYLKYDGVKKAL